MVLQNSGTQITEDRYANCSNFKSFVVADGTVSIGKGAFRSCVGLKKIYIPASVETIVDKAFEGCTDLEIFCEAEPTEGWVYGMKKGIIRYRTVTPEDYVFNFHRGPMSDTLVEREEEWFHNWNPLNRPVHTHVGRDVTNDWD